MTSPHAQPAVELAATTAEAVRQLNHLTLVPRALSGPAELDRIVAELATMAVRLPQLLRQLGSWLEAEQLAGRIRSDNSTDPTRIVARAATQLAAAGHAAHELDRTLDGAHQQLAHLGARSAAGAVTSRPASAVRDGRAETVATSGHFHGHQRAGYVAAVGQIPLSLDRGMTCFRWRSLHSPVPGCVHS